MPCQIQLLIPFPKYSRVILETQRDLLVDFHRMSLQGSGEIGIKRHQDCSVADCTVADCTCTAADWAVCSGKMMMMQEAMIGKDAVPGLEVMSDDYSGFRLRNAQARAMPQRTLAGRAVVGSSCLDARNAIWA